jgi:hypothetical protein
MARPILGFVDVEPAEFPTNLKRTFPLAKLDKFTSAVFQESNETVGKLTPNSSVHVKPSSVEACNLRGDENNGATACPATNPNCIFGRVVVVDLLVKLVRGTEHPPEVGRSAYE